MVRTTHLGFFAPKQMARFIAFWIGGLLATLGGSIFAPMQSFLGSGI